MAHTLRRMRLKAWYTLQRMRKEVVFLCVVGVVMTMVVYNFSGKRHVNENSEMDMIEERYRKLSKLYAKRKELDEFRQKEEERRNIDNLDLKDPVDRLMHEDQQAGIIWGKVRGGRTFPPDLGLKKSDKDDSKNNENQKSKKNKAQELLSANAKYFQSIHDKGYLGNDTIKSGGLQGGKAHCQLYDLKSLVGENFECQNLSIKPRTPICLYPDKADVHVSRHIREEGIWEPHIVMEFQNKLYGDPDLGVIDIGANIGQYSLIAASMGHKVVAVEPHIPNIERLHRASQLGKVEENIVVVQNGISDVRKSLELKLYADNQGGVALTEEFADPWCEGSDCPAKTQTILMDDLLEVINFEKAIIKIDIEGHEHRAFVRSLRLLQEVYVPYIFMEWIKLRSYYGSEVDESPDKSLVFQMVDFFSHRDYHAYSLVTGAKLKTPYWYAWPDDIIWKHELADMQ